MKLNWRFSLESIIVSLTLLVFYYGIQMVRGYLLTKKYEPDVVLNQGPVDQLQSSASFGSIYEHEWVVGLVCFVLMAVVYYGVRNWMHRLRVENKRT